MDSSRRSARVLTEVSPHKGKGLTGGAGWPWPASGTLMGWCDVHHRELTAELPPHPHANGVHLLRPQGRDALERTTFKAEGPPLWNAHAECHPRTLQGTRPQSNKVRRKGSSVTLPSVPFAVTLSALFMRAHSNDTSEFTRQNVIQHSHASSPPCVTVRLVVVSLRGPGQSPVRPFACCVGSLLSVGRCGRCSCWCRFRVRGAQSLVCWGCAGCGRICS